MQEHEAKVRSELKQQLTFSGQKAESGKAPNQAQNEEFATFKKEILARIDDDRRMRNIKFQEIYTTLDQEKINTHELIQQ